MAGPVAPDLRCYVGLMSGTSMDGVDAALVDFSTSPGRLLATHFLPYPDPVRDEALRLNVPGQDELDRSARLAVELADLYASAVDAVLHAGGVQAAEVAAVGCHGQTVRHRPDLGYTIQLVNGARLAERCGITVVTDFRSRDVAARGQGAPLVPAFHRAMFASRDADRVVVNLGGIANITWLPRQEAVLGFDTGPGNLLLDMWASTYINRPVDREGRFARSGTSQRALLDRMLADPFFGLPPPKSTGRDHFNRAWLDRLGLAGYPPEDVQATLAQLTAESIAQAIARHCPGAAEVFLCGGGVHNLDLVERIGGALPACKVDSTAALGVDPDWVEAFAFAWLARCAIEGEPGNLPAVTGAAGPRRLGAIYPA